MNANDIKWITSGGLEHDPFYFSIPEKLEKYGYCIDFSGYGEGKLDKAQLCIIDTINKKQQPNILIVCPRGGKESWYTCLLKGVGLDFKFINSSADSVMYFSKGTSNLLLLDEGVLADDEPSSYDTIKQSGLLWDLIIIDGSGAVDGLDIKLYTEKLGMKTERLLLFAPYPAIYLEAPDKLRDIVKALLKDIIMAEAVNEVELNEKAMEFTVDSPLANYPRNDNINSSVRIIRYAFPDSEIPAGLHIDEQESSRYSHGGNVFEEYNLPERKIYLKPQYTRSDAETLKNKDKKLEKFLDVIDDIMMSTDETAIVYFESEATAEYIEKILSSIYYDKTDSIAFFQKNSFNSRFLKQWYETMPSKRIRVILANDSLSEVVGIYSPITHIINYELPDSPVSLHQRYMRRSLIPGEKPEFIIFLDNNKLFDSRILARVLAGNLYKAFRTNIPSENIMFSIDGLDVMLAETIADIKYISEYTGAVGASFDVINHFKSDYNVPAARNLTTAANTHEYSKRKLETICDALGVGEFIKEKDIDKSALTDAIDKKIREIRTGYSYFDRNMFIRTIPADTSRTQEFRQYEGYLDGNPFNLGLRNARAALERAVEGKNDFVYVKDAVSSLPDTMKPAVLYNIWVYWHKELGVGGSYAQFIKEYNEGVI